MVISPYARTGYIDHQTLSFDAYLKFIEDDFLGGQRIDPATDGRPDPRPDVRGNAGQLGNLAADFDFSRAPRPGVVLSTTPITDLRQRLDRRLEPRTAQLADSAVPGKFQPLGRDCEVIGSWERQLTETVSRREFKASSAGRTSAWSPREVAHPEIAEERRRTLGLALLATAAAAIGGAMLLWAGTWFGASDIAAGSGLETAARLIAPMLVVVAVGQLLFAYGVWELRSWAWPLGVGLTIAALMFTELSAGRGSSGAHTASLLLEIGTLWYLLSPRVHEILQTGRGNT